MARAKKTVTVLLLTFSGQRRFAWLKQELANSRATWKVIAADMPIGLLVVYDVDRKWGVEAIAQG
jgi:alkaline phosphatase D